METPTVKVLYSICVSEMYGTQGNVLSTIRSLDPDRFSCVVAAPPGGGFLDAAARLGASVHEVPMRGLADAAALAALTRIIRKENIDIIHCHLGISSFLGILAAKAAGLRRRVVTRHFIRDQYTTVKPSVYPVYRMVYRWMAAETDVMVCVSEAVKNAVAKREKIPAAKLRVIPNGIPLPGAVDRAAAREEVRREFGFPPDAPLVVTLSRLVSEKGLDTLAEAAGVCRARRPATRFIVAGDGPLRSELAGLTKHLGLSGSFVFAGFRRDAEKLLAAADLFVLPSPEEPFGIALVEAMSLGLPCVAMAAGGPAEIVENEITGLLCPPGRPDALADAMSRILAEPETAAALGRNATVRARDFDEKAVAGRIASVYDELMRAKP